MNQLPFNLISYGLSDIGLVRSNNEDVWSFLEENRFFALADGMGGHNAGEIAAKETVLFVCSFIQELFVTNKKKWTVFDLCSFTKLCIENANYWIYQMGKQNKEYRGMGTTLCTLLFHERSLIYSHVGDSRIYRFRKHRLDQLTIDHSLKNKLLSEGKFHRSSKYPVNYKNILTRAIGTHGQVKAEIHIAPVNPDDLYLMCSDGLTDCVSDREIFSILEQTKDPKKATKMLIDTAKEKGGIDNITIVSVHVDEQNLCR